MLTQTHEEARLTLTVEGARHRLRLAEDALRVFELENFCFVGGQRVLVADGEMRDSMEREHHALLVEHDAAARHLRKSLEDLAETVEGSR